MIRHYLRCRDCLTAHAREQEAAPESGGPCPLCGGKTEYMGRVTPAGPLSRAYSFSPCDTRCTRARGPLCDCPCRGEHHGSGLVVTYETGTAKLPEALDGARARRWAAEYLEAKAAARAAFEARFGAVVAKRRVGGWLSGAEFGRYLEAEDFGRALATANRLRTHSGRLKALGAILARIAEKKATG